MYQNKVNSSLTSVQRPGHYERNCKMDITNEYLPRTKALLGIFGRGWLAKVQGKAQFLAVGAQRHKGRLNLRQPTKIRGYEAERTSFWQTNRLASNVLSCFRLFNNLLCFKLFSDKISPVKKPMNPGLNYVRKCEYCNFLVSHPFVRKTESKSAGKFVITASTGMYHLAWDQVL